MMKHFTFLVSALAIVMLSCQQSPSPLTNNAAIEPQDPPTALAKLSDGLVAFYPFDGNANDKSGHGYHGTVYGAKLAKDRFGKSKHAYRFDGVDDYIAVNNFPMLDRTFTYTAWLKVLGTTVHHQSFGAHGEGGAVGETWNFGYNTYHKVWDMFDRRNYTWQVPMDIGSSWTHVAIVYDNSVRRIYVNGIQLGSHVITTPLVPGRSNTLRIGTLTPGDQQYEGLIDDVRIYNRALTDKEIRKLYR
jgi:Concanavalin A-like lectin/glucanases superfamily